MDAPVNIRADKQSGVMYVDWPDGRTDALPYWEMRCACPCAACISEFTGEKLLDESQVPRDVAPYHVELSGNYALKVWWSDGHSTGLYTWTRLRSLGHETKKP